MLAVLATHPIQYQTPIWKRLAERGHIPFEVFYLTRHGVKPSFDRQFCRVFQWDLDLLNGYPYRFPREPAAEQLGGFWDVRLAADFKARLLSGECKALLVHGWNVLACWEAVSVAHRAGVAVWMRGESNDLKVDGGAKRMFKRLLLGGLFVRVDRFLCVGEANRRLYQSYGIGFERLVNGLYCVENSRFAQDAARQLPDRDALRRRFGIPSEAFCLLFVGKFIPKKRPLDVVAAARLLAGSDQSRDYHLLFVGTGELGDEIRSQTHVVYDAESKSGSATEKNGIAPRASFAGFLNQSEISKAYVAADALVLASDAEETWGLVVNEAMASGLPCVVSASCGSAEDLAAPLDPHLTYACGDIHALAESILHLADHPPPAKAIAERIARYDYIETVDALEQLWVEAASR